MTVAPSSGKSERRMNDAGSKTVRETQDEERDHRFRDRIITVPNIICAFRLAGAVALFPIAIHNRPGLFATMFTVLSLSDWIDGKLARWLHQRSDFGARLDSFADSVLYGALFFGLVKMKWDVLQPETAWWLTAFLSYVLTTAAGLIKYGRIPSYHTYGAKTTQWIILAGGVCLLLDYTIWPFRLAMLGTILTNLEATAITYCLKEWRADVLTIRHVWPAAKSPEKSSQ